MTDNMFWCQKCGNTNGWKHLYGNDGEYLVCNACNTIYQLPSQFTQPSMPPPPLPQQPILSTQIKKQSFFEKLANVIKEKREQKDILRKQKKEEEYVIEAIKSEARQEAFKELKPELIKKFKEDEIKRLTGQDKQDKLKKFADAFKLGDVGKNMDVAEMMTGKRNNTNIQQQDSVLIGNDKISKMMNIGNTANNEQLDKMLKRKKKYG